MPENQLVTEIYVPEAGKGFKRWLVVLALFFVAFLWTFPFQETITSKVETLILGQRACPVSYSKMNFTWFAPGIEFDKPIISGACFQKPGNDLPLKTLAVSFAGPNFSPLGVRLKVVADTEQSHLEAYPAAGFGSQVVRIVDTNIGADILNTLTGMDLLVGTIAVDGLIELAQNQVSSAKFKLESKKISTKATNIQGFDLPSMNLGSLLLTSELDAAGKLFIEKLTLGANDSSIAANFKGSIQLNKYNMNFSNADLTGEVRFSDELRKELDILNFITSGKEANDGFYKVEIKGPIAQTIPRFL